MPEADKVLADFLDQRPRLRLLAYRLLGSVGDADDVVQDAWVKWAAVAGRVEAPAAFLTTQVTRLALDRLRTERRRRALARQWLPDPWTDPVEPDAADLSTGLLLLLERLSPSQRAVYVLREAMDLDFTDIATVLDRPADTCRQIMARARAALKGQRRYDWDQGQTAALVRHFAAACEQRDYAALVSLMNQDSRLVSYAGTKGKAALNPILGADRIIRFLFGVRRKFLAADFHLRPAQINGMEALLGIENGTVRWVLTFGCADGGIERIYLQADPDVLPVSPPGTGIPD